LIAFMTALVAAIPGSVWLSETMHHPACRLDWDEMRVDRETIGLSLDACTCAVAKVVIVKRLQPTASPSGNGDRS
jgi:hypothetical protein